VPENLSSVTIQLEYLLNRTNETRNNTFYLTIGNTTVFSDNITNTTQSVTLTDANLTPLLNYSVLAGSTVPLRMGFENLTYTTIFSGTADVALVTDTSGSMAWRMDQDNVDGDLYECTNPLINASNAQRLSVAKCLDKQFANDILNITGNLISIVNYRSTTQTGNTVPLTANITNITQTIGNTTSGYVASGGTCICCGINSALTELNRGVTRTVHVTTGSVWRYNRTSNTVSPPPLDAQNRTWYHPDYSAAVSWLQGPSPLGGNANGTGIAFITDMGSTLSTSTVVPVLWERGGDYSTPEVDFTSGLNTTGNTFGISGADDGWDWANGTYGYGGPVNFPGVVGGELVIQANTSPSNRNNCANNDCSGAYGIRFNVTANHTALLQNGTARIAFRYRWTPVSGNPFENSDEVWVKARLTQPGGVIVHLGSEQSNQGGDATPEIDFRNNPNIAFSGTYSTDATGLFTTNGTYYFDLGGKLQASATNEWGAWYFDDILVSFTNATDAYYLRTNFTITNVSTVQTAFLNLASDDRATVYLNGNLVVDEGLAHDAVYWNLRGLPVPVQYFRPGVNVLAVRVENLRGMSAFDAELITLNTSRPRAMLAMTDGEATSECVQQDTGDAKQDAILAACQAREQYGVTVHAVGFSSTVDAPTLDAVAACGGGLFLSSANTTALADFYSSVVISILDSTLKSQSIIVSGGYALSTLFPTSTIQFTHAATAPQPAQNEVVLKTQTPPLGSCTPTVFINPSVRVLAARITSYSADHWTDLLVANGVTAYNLSTYSTPYIRLGDPFEILFPAGAVGPGTNDFLVNTGDSPSNATGCSPDNTLITDIAVPINPTYTPVLEYAEGCSWTIEQDTGFFQTIRVPREYVGANTCSYTNASIAFNSADAYDVATANLLASLDYDRDGRIFISLADEDVEIIVNTVSNVPYLWGPTSVEVWTWQ
jgi:hypothetical protein